MPTPQATQQDQGTRTAATEVLIFPIGQYVGSFERAGRPDGPRHHVCRGARIAELTGESFAVWGLAHGPLDPIIARSTPWTRAELEQYAGRAGIDDATWLTANLVERGLLVETPREGPDARAFADTHRAMPILLGLGNTAEDPETFTIGQFDQDALEVGEGLYEVWAWSGTDDSLWQVCETSARLTRDADDPDPQLTDPAGVLALFLASAHGMLSASAMYLDVVDATPGHVRAGDEEEVP